MNAAYIVAGLIINALRPRALLGVAAILIGIVAVQKEASAAILVLHPSGAFSGDTAVYDPDAVTALDSNDGDGTMGELDSSGGKFYLELDDPAASGAINSVQVKIVVRYSGTGNTMQFKIGVGTGGTFYLSPTITHSTDGYAEYGGDIYTTNPQTNAPWTWADIASLVAAVDYGADCCRMYITELYAEIDYTPGTAITLSGVLFSDEGITPVSGQTVRLVVEGNSVGTDITDLGGNYSISAVINPTYNIWYIPLLVYVDDGVVDATTVTTMDSTVNAGAIPDLHLYADHLVTRQDASSAPLDTGDMNAAKGSYADTDILYSISWPDTTVTGANTELYIPGGHGFTPFGNIATPHLKINGTLNAGGNTFTVSGDWTNNGTFIAGTSTVVLGGSGQQISGSTGFHHFTKTVSSADTLIFTAGTTQTITGTVTLNGASGQLLSLRSSTPGTRWNFNLATGASKAISYVDVQDSDASGSDSPLLEINPSYSINSGNNVSWFGSANITVTKSSVVISDPVNGGSNPKRIPGAVVEYTITVTNTAGAQATNITVTNELSSESATLGFDANGYATGKGIQVTAPNINGGAALNLTNTADTDQGDYGVTTANTVTVGGITLNAGEQATIKFQVIIQ